MKKVTPLTAALIISLTIPSFSQTSGLVSGIVTDEETNFPLIGANILVLNDSSGTSTDDNGRFELLLPPGSQRLRISYIGYSARQLTAEVFAGDTILLEIKLASDTMYAETVIIEGKAVDSKYVPQKITLSRRLITEMVTTTPDIL
ncbi:carboxypeptidase-like regulatory domain-containing protein, partial [candidate division KSB1 bacterium]